MIYPPMDVRARDTILPLALSGMCHLSSYLRTRKPRNSNTFSKESLKLKENAVEIRITGQMKQVIPPIDASIDRSICLLVYLHTYLLHTYVALSLYLSLPLGKTITSCNCHPSRTRSSISRLEEKYHPTAE